MVRGSCDRMAPGSHSLCDGAVFDVTLAQYYGPKFEDLLDERVFLEMIVGAKLGLHCTAWVPAGGNA